MWGSDCEESWVLKNWCFWTVVLEKTLESPLDCKEIKPVHPKGNQSWIFIGRTDAETETPILWPPDAKNWLIGKGPDAGKDWRQEEKGMTEDEMARWHPPTRWTMSLNELQELVMDREAWRAAVYGFTKSQTWLSHLAEFNLLKAAQRKVGGEGGDWGWAGWMSSPTQWTWVWVNSGSWSWTGRPGVMQSMGSEHVYLWWIHFDIWQN